MAVLQVKGGHQTANPGERPLKRRHFLKALATANLALAGSLAACGRRGDLKPPPVEPKTTAPDEDTVE